jgi:hypothetical protein
MLSATVKNLGMASDPTIIGTQAIIINQLIPEQMKSLLLNLPSGNTRIEILHSIKPNHRLASRNQSSYGIFYC